MKAEERGVRKYFEKVGKVKQVIMIRDKYTNRHKGFAYVEMKDLESIPLVLMLNGTVPDFQKFPILIKASEAEKNFLAKQEATPVTDHATGGVVVPSVQNRLYVGNLHVHITEDDLRSVLQPFGEIESVHLHRDEVGTSKGYAFVKFLKSDDANLAMQKIGGLGLELMGKAIKVGFVNEQSGSGVTGASANWKLDDDEGSGLQMNAQSRVALMARLGQNAGITPPMGNPMSQVVPNQAAIDAAKALAAQAAAKSSTQLAGAGPVAGAPSFCFLIRNMFDPATETDEGWDSDIKEDVEGECSKFGTLLHSYVETRQPGGLVYLLFSTVDSSMKAAQSLHGRWFAGRMITCEFLPPDRYAAQFPEASGAVSTANATLANAGGRY